MGKGNLCRTGAEQLQIVANFSCSGRARLRLFAIRNDQHALGIDRLLEEKTRGLRNAPPIRQGLLDSGI